MDTWDFNVTVTGSGVVSFTNSTTIYNNAYHRTPTESAVFIQTDKAVYKTGQKGTYIYFAGR